MSADPDAPHGPGSNTKGYLGTDHTQGIPEQPEITQDCSISQNGRVHKVFGHMGGRTVWQRVRVRACSHCDRSVSPRHRRSPRGGCLLAAQRYSDDAARMHLEVDSRGRCAAVAGHGLVIRHELASVAASGRIGRC